MQESISLLFCPSRVRSSWLLPDLSDVLLLLPEGIDPSTCSRQMCCCWWAPCFYGQTLSCTVPAYCTGPPCRKRHKYWCWKNIGACQDFIDFCQTIVVYNSQPSYQKLVKTKSDHHHCPISVHILITPNWGRHRDPMLRSLNVPMGRDPCGWGGRKERGGNALMFLAIIQLCTLFLSQKTVLIRDQLFLYMDTRLTKKFVLDISITF